MTSADHAPHDQPERIPLTISGRVPDDDWMRLPTIRDLVTGLLIRKLGVDGLAAFRNDPCYFEVNDGRLDLYIGEDDSRVFCGRVPPGALPPPRDKIELN